MNELIGTQIRNKIIDKVKKAKYFSILVDEVCDTSNWEQVSIVLRYVDEDESIREDFIAFVPCAENTGESIANSIVQKIRDRGLDIENVRGQVYDGAVNMAGKFKGVQARIRELNEKALYVHCASHCLNLCVMKACTVPQIKNMFETIKELSTFFSPSPNRKGSWKKCLRVRLQKKKEKETR